MNTNRRDRHSQSECAERGGSFVGGGRRVLRWRRANDRRGAEAGRNGRGIVLYCRTEGNEGDGGNGGSVGAHEGGGPTERWVAARPTGDVAKGGAPPDGGIRAANAWRLRQAIAEHAYIGARRVSGTARVKPGKGAAAGSCYREWGRRACAAAGAHTANAGRGGCYSIENPEERGFSPRCLRCFVMQPRRQHDPTATPTLRYSPDPKSLP